MADNFIDLPMESRNKYGRMDDWSEAGDEFARALSGGSAPVRSQRVPSVDDPNTPNEVDEDFLRSAGNSPNKYGG